MYSRRYLYSGISAGCFLLSILPILQLQQGVLQYGFDNEFRDWVKGGLCFVSWTGFNISGCCAFYLAIENWYVKEE